MSKKKAKHVGIIPDGNRRWAKAHGMEKEDGYTYGLQPGLDLFHVPAGGEQDVPQQFVE